MKKIYIGGLLACGTHNEKSMIKKCVSNSSKYIITDDYYDADIIVIIDTCASTYNTILSCFKYIEGILSNKKDNSTVIVSGCLAKGMKIPFSEKQKQILSQVICVEPDKVIEYVARMIELDMNDEMLDVIKLPFSFVVNGVMLSPVTGCLNNCSFCKSNYLNFPLQSVPIELLERFSSNIAEIRGMDYISIHSSNLSLYGVDLYNKQKCHEAISILTRPESIKFANIGALINWYPELINEILNNPKIKTIFTSLESGSARIYELMNRPISLDKLKEIIKIIRKERPDILIRSEFICGFPTETIDDLKESIDTFYELDIFPEFLHPYANSTCIPSSKLEQHSFNYCVKTMNYAADKLAMLRRKFENIIKNAEMLVLAKNTKYDIYAVMLITGNIKYVRFDQFEDEYNVNDIIPSNKIKVKHKKIIKG